MQTVTLGHTGQRVSALCLGAMYFGTLTDEVMSFALLDQYVAAGGGFIDTANIYAHWTDVGSGGESEALLGRWIKQRGNRAEVFLASKVGFEYPGVERGLSARQIETECDKSLRRLGVETIDLYYAHVDDRHTPLDETLAAFDRLVRAGKVRFVGASNYAAWRLAEARAISAAQDVPAFCCVQQRHTYLRPKPGTTFDPQLAANDDLLDYCRTHQAKIALLAYSPLLSGAYTRADRPVPGQYAGPDTDARLAALRQVAAAHEATLNQIVLAWMLHSDPVVIPVFAASTPAQMAENLGALTLALTPDQMAALDGASA